MRRIASRKVRGEVLRLSRRIRQHDPFVIEVVGGGSVLAWGVYAIWAGHTLEDFSTYDVLLQEHVPESFWYGWAITSGVLQLIAALRHRPWQRLTAAFSQLTWCNVVGVAILHGPTPTPGCVLYFGLGTGALWSMLYLAPSRAVAYGS